MVLDVFDICGDLGLLLLQTGLMENCRCTRRCTSVRIPDTSEAVEMSRSWQLPRSSVIVNKDTVAKAQNLESLRTALRGEVAEKDASRGVT